MAVRRARFAFRRIPEEAFEDPNLPIPRRHWQDWFKWTGELGLYGGDGSS